MTLDEARAILDDHAQGLHWRHDMEDGCTYPACDAAWWMITTMDEHA